ncbi:MAG: hypothetical protein ABIP29_01225 [Candidatus Eisenbacteria bacterium]
MEDRPTCGRGLAEHSVVPAALGDLVAAMADVLAAHRKALDLSDPDAKREDEAYALLAQEQHAIAAALWETARRMSSDRDLPMGRHDEAVMSGGPAVEAFKEYVGHEGDLAALLRKRVEQDRAMLEAMGAA